MAELSMIDASLAVVAERGRAAATVTAVRTDLASLAVWGSRRTSSHSTPHTCWNATSVCGGGHGRRGMGRGRHDQSRPLHDPALL